MSEQRLSGDIASSVFGVSDRVTGEDAALWPPGLSPDALPLIIWAADAVGRCTYVNPQWYNVTGLRFDDGDEEERRTRVHPDDRDGMDAAWNHSVTSGDPFETEYRLLCADGQYRWMLARAAPTRADAGEIIGWAGTCVDIHDHRISLEERQRLHQEMAHRIKNIFAVIAGLIGLSARATTDIERFAEGLRARVLALGRAHDVIRSLAPPAAGIMAETDNGLHGLLRGIFAPYDTVLDCRVTIHGPDVAIDDRCAAPLALAFHEIVANAARYGALSAEGGSVVLAVESEGTDTRLTWQERGGPVLADRPTPGFGFRLLDLIIRRQLNGRYDEFWDAEGLTIRITAPLTSRGR